MATAPYQSVSSASAPLSLRRGGFRAAWDVWCKDWRSEWRLRTAVNSVALFSIAASVALGFALAGQTVRPDALGGLLWTVLFFAALAGLPRAFVKEEENGTGALLRLHFTSEAVLGGKAIGQLVLLLCTQAAAVPVFLLLLSAKIPRPEILVAVLVLGDIGLAMSSTLLGAIAAQARARGTLFAAISVPVLLPLLVMASKASAVAFGARESAAVMLQMLLAFDVLVVACAWMLFEFVWE